MNVNGIYIPTAMMLEKRRTEESLIRVEALNPSVHSLFADIFKQLFDLETKPLVLRTGQFRVE